MQVMVPIRELYQYDRSSWTVIGVIESNLDVPHQPGFAYCMFDYILGRNLMHVPQQGGRNGCAVDLRSTFIFELAG
jgi:hypothetical protein